MEKEMNSFKKLSEIVVAFDHYSARQAIDEIVSIVGLEVLEDYIEELRKETPNDNDENFVTYYLDGEECSIGCKNHISHPCEKCGRKGARGQSGLVRYFPW
jgi:hypothetical protein